MEDKKLVLIVIFDDEMRNVLINAFRENECPFICKDSNTVEEALEVLSQNTVNAIIMTRTEALVGDGEENGLIVTRSTLPPTVTILKRGDEFPDYCYPPYENNDWITTPFDIQELYLRVLGVIKRANK